MSKLDVIQEIPPVADIFIGSHSFKSSPSISFEEICEAMENCLSKVKDVTYVFSSFHWKCQFPHFSSVVNVYRSAEADNTFVFDVQRADGHGGFGNAEFARALKFLLIQEKVVPLPVLLTPEEAAAKKLADKKAWLVKAKAMMARKTAEAAQV